MKTSFPAGFTLAELITVIAVLGILALVSLPNYQSFMAQRRLNGATRQVASDLTFARMQAITTNRDIHVNFSLAYSNRYTLDFTGKSLIRNVQKHYSDVTVKSSITPVIFHPDGASSNLVIKVLNTIGEKTITISRIGRIKIN